MIWLPAYVCPGDWYFSLDLKDAHFHIQIAPHHGRFFNVHSVRLSTQYAYQWAIPSSPLFYEVHRSGSFFTETAGNPHLELPHSGPVEGRASISQIRAPRPLRVPRTQGQFCQERAVPQPTNFVPGNSYRLSLNEGCGHTRTCTGHSAARSSIQTRSISEDAGPHGLSIFGTFWKTAWDAMTTHYSHRKHQS